VKPFPSAKIREKRLFDRRRSLFLRLAALERPAFLQTNALLENLRYSRNGETELSPAPPAGKNAEDYTSDAPPE